MRESLLTAQEVAELLGVASSSVYERSRGGRIPTVTLGGYRPYRHDVITARLDQLENERSVAEHTSCGGGVTPGRHERRSVAADSVRAPRVNGATSKRRRPGDITANVKMRSE